MRYPKEERSRQGAPQRAKAGKTAGTVVVSALLAASIAPASALADDGSQAEAADPAPGTIAGLGALIAGEPVSQPAAPAGSAEPAGQGVAADGAAAAGAVPAAADASASEPGAEAVEPQAGTIAIDEKTFPDPVFRVWVQNNLAGGKATMTQEQADAVTSIVLTPNEPPKPDTKTVKDLTGIGVFKNLETLDFSDNAGITAVDLSGNTRLHTLNGEWCSLAKLDLSANNELQYVDVGSNKLTEVVMPSSPYLTYFKARGTAYPLGTLSKIENLSACTGLEELDVAYNALTEIDLSQLSHLKRLLIDKNQLTSLDLSANGEITEVQAGNNPSLTSFKGSASLADLSISGSGLTSLDLSDSPSLTTLSVSNTKSLVSLDVSGCPKLSELTCNADALTELDLSKNPALAKLSCYRNKMTKLDLTANLKVTKVDCYENSLESIAVGAKDGQFSLNAKGNKLLALDLSDVKRVGTINVSSNERAIEAPGGVVDTGSFDGFDPKKVSNVENASFDAEKGTFSGMIGGEEVTYDYEYAPGKTVSFTIAPTVTVQTEGGKLGVVDAAGAAVKAPGGAPAEAAGLAGNVAVEGASVKDGSILVPNDAAGNAPIAATLSVKDSDGDGLGDAVAVTAYYPYALKVSASEALSDPLGAPAIVNVPVSAKADVVNDAGDDIGSVRASSGYISIDYDDNYNDPINAQVIGTKDADGDGIADEVIVRAWYPVGLVNESGRALYDKDSKAVEVRVPVAADAVYEGATTQGTWGADLEIVVPSKDGLDPVTASFETHDADGDGVADKVVVTPAYPIPVVGEDGAPIKVGLASTDGIAKVDKLDPNAVIEGGAFKDGEVVVPSDAHGNAPIAVTVKASDFNDEGGARSVVITPTYPVPILSEAGAPIPDRLGGNAKVAPFDDDAEPFLSGATFENGVITVPNDSFGNAPYQVGVRTGDGDSDGYIDSVAVSPTYPIAVINEAGEPVVQADGSRLTLDAEPDGHPALTVVGGSYDAVRNAITVPNDAAGNAPASAWLAVSDADHDGLVDRIGVSATYPTAPDLAFDDVDPASWYAPGVRFVATKGLMYGYEGTSLFGVGDPMTRAQFVTMLWRHADPSAAEGYDQSSAKNETGLSDVGDGAFYTGAANWAVLNGVVSGVEGEGGTRSFDPDGAVTFEQAVAILANMQDEGVVSRADQSVLDSFADGAQVSAWARQSMAWGVSAALVNGYVENDGVYLRPIEPVARERMATVVMNAFEVGALK